METYPSNVTNTTNNTVAGVVGVVVGVVGTAIVFCFDFFFFLSVLRQKEKKSA